MRFYFKFSSLPIIPIKINISFIIRILSIAIITMILSCTKDDLPTQVNTSSIHSYEEALSRWNSLNYHNYIFYQYYNGWGPGITGPVRLTVLADTIAEIKLVSNDSLLDHSWQRFQTVGQLFSNINFYSAMDTSRYVLSVTYDSVYGYPLSWHVYIKPPPTDFSIGSTSWDLKPLIIRLYIAH
jgi:hypothetical protein